MDAVAVVDATQYEGRHWLLHGSRAEFTSDKSVVGSKVGKPWTLKRGGSSLAVL